MTMTGRDFDKRSALFFIVSFGAVSFFADMAYEGMRSVTGPFLAALGASGAAVGLIAGTGELAGYLLRLLSGRAAEKSHLYWPITLLGYLIQMAAVPLLALAGNWWLAAGLIVMERTGKAVRSPAASTMKSRAGAQIGQGWAFGLHEAMDQTGAMTGPLIAALVLWLHRDYRMAFAWLAVPAALTLVSVTALRLGFPYAGNVARETNLRPHADLTHAFWLYAVSAGLVAFGFADYPLIAYHFAKAAVMGPSWVPILYAFAMGMAGLGSLLFGRWFDRRGLIVLVPGTLIGAAVAPLAFLGGFDDAAAGTILWGLALGIHEAVMSAAVAELVPEHARARAYGIFTALFGLCWFAGSALAGALYDVSLPLLVAVSVGFQLLGLIPLLAALRAIAAPRC
ncbi:MAG: MFS transporter [Alphaproteobacteria bacterium]|nr:MFS transporter [Alphaproteobacteria bacterium]